MERTPEHEIVAKYRAKQSSLCAVCKYPLVGVPMSSDQRLTCPECGFVTQFRVRVEMVAHRGEASAEADRRMRRADRTATLIAMTLFVVVVGLLVLMVIGVL